MEIAPTSRPDSWQSRQGARRRKALHRGLCNAPQASVLFSLAYVAKKLVAKKLRSSVFWTFCPLTSRTRTILRFSCQPPAATQMPFASKAQQAGRCSGGRGQNVLETSIPIPYGPDNPHNKHPTRMEGAGESPRGGQDAERGGDGHLHEGSIPLRAPHGPDPRGWRLLPSSGLTISL